jgi:hypothetical protein
MVSIADVNIASSEFKANPFPFYARLPSEAPVYQTKLPDRRNVWLVTRYNDVLTELLLARSISVTMLTAYELPMRSFRCCMRTFYVVFRIGPDPTDMP